MHYTIEMLMKGDASVVRSFQNAQSRWEKILGDIDSVSIEELAKRLSSEQYWFESNCGGRWEGQEVMAWTGFAFLCPTSVGYDGKESRGEKLAKAFGTSMCSLEVKGYAKRAAKSYYIDL